MAQLLLPVGPWNCTTCGRELLLIVDANSPPGTRETVRDQCGAEHFSPGRCLGLYWRGPDGNWLEISQPQPTEESHERQPAA